MSMIVTKEAVISGHKDSVYKILPLNEKDFCSTGADGLVVQWSLDDPTNGKLFAKLQNPSYTMAFSEERNHLVVGENFEGIHVLDVKSKKEIVSRKLTDKEIFSCAFIDQDFWVGTSDGKILVLDSNYEKKQEIHLSHKSARCIAAFGNQVAVGYSDSIIRVFSKESHELLHEVKGHKQSVFSLVYSPDGKRLISCGRDATLKIWDVEGGYLLEKEVIAHMYTINHITFSPDGKHFVTCSMDKSIKIWDAFSLRLLKVIDKGRYAGHGTSVNCTFWSSQDKIVSCSDDRSISVWSLTM